MLQRLIALGYFSLIKCFLKHCGKRNRICLSSTFTNKGNIVLGDDNLFRDGTKLITQNKLTLIKIGNRNKFDFNCIINSHHGYVILGNDNFIGPNCILQGFGGIEIGNNCMIAGNTFLSSSNHDYSNPQREDYLKAEIGDKISIHDNVWIGANVVITAGVKLGNHSIIGAGSVVTKNVEPYSIVAGVPAKQIRSFNFVKLIWDSI